MRTKLILASSFLALAASGSAFAQNSGFYGGIGLGQSKIKLDRGDFRTDPPGTVTFDEKDTAWKFFAGHKFHPNFAAEVSYTDFGKAQATFTEAGVSERGDYKASSLALWGVGMAPIATGFSALGKIGLSSNEAKRSNIGTEPGAKKRKTQLVWGLGAQYDFNPRFGVRVEYEDFGKFGDAFSDTGNQTGRAKVSMVSVSIVGRF